MPSLRTGRATLAPDLFALLARASSFCSWSDGASGPHGGAVYRLWAESARAGSAAKYLDDRGLRVLATLDAIAERMETTVAAVSLAWLLTRPAVVAPIASARTPEQLAELLPAVSRRLDGDELKLLADASA